jgi:hypothetical protein
MRQFTRIRVLPIRRRCASTLTPLFFASSYLVEAPAGCESSWPSSTAGRRSWCAARTRTRGDSHQAGLSDAEYRATVESCSERFHVDMPNVMRARACCTYRDHMMRFSGTYIALIVATVLLFPHRKEEQEVITTIVVIVTTL